MTAVQYILRNPVKEKIVEYPWEYRWSSAGYHCGLVSHDLLVREDELLSGVGSWRDFLEAGSELRPLLEEKNRTVDHLVLTVFLLSWKN